MARSTFRFVLTSSLILAAGCQIAPSSGMKRLVDPIEAGQLGYRYRWSWDLGMPAGRRVDQVAVLEDLIVVVESPSNLVSAISLRDGSVQWTRQVGDSLDQLHTPVRHRDHILLNSETHLYRLNSFTGDVLETQLLKTAVSHAPVLVGDLAIYGGANGHVFAQNLDDGFSRWAYDVRSPIAARPVLAANQLITASTRGEYHVLAPASGRILHKGRTFARISASPVATESVIYVASEDHTLYALNLPTLQDRWKFRAPRPLTRSPIIIRNLVYLPVPNYGLIAIDALNGEKLWEFRDVRALPVDSRDNNVLLHAGDQFVLMGADTGRTVASVATKPLLTVLRTAAHSLILVSSRGELMRLDRG